MSERYGPCPTCRGRGLSYSKKYENDDEICYTKSECGGCDGTGFWGGAFPPGSTHQKSEIIFYGTQRDLKHDHR